MCIIHSCVTPPTQGWCSFRGDEANAFAWVSTLSRCTGVTPARKRRYVDVLVAMWMRANDVYDCTYVSIYACIRISTYTTYKLYPHHHLCVYISLHSYKPLSAFSVSLYQHLCNYQYLYPIYLCIYGCSSLSPPLRSVRLGAKSISRATQMLMPSRKADEGAYVCVNVGISMQALSMHICMGMCMYVVIVNTYHSPFNII